MARILITLFLVILSLSNSNAQEIPVKKEASEEYIKEAISFLTEVKKKEFTDPSFTLAELPKFACFAFTVDDSITFAKEELKQIESEINLSNVTNWKDLLPSNIRFLKESVVNSVSKSIKNPKRETRLFKKKFGGCYHNFSAPIFLRNYTFCLLYVDKICSAGQSSGALQVFEKVDGVWKQMTSRCEWTE